MATVATVPGPPPSDAMAAGPSATLEISEETPKRKQRAAITQNLVSLGSVVLSDYADVSTDYDPFQPKKRPSLEPVEPKTSESSVVSAVAKLNKAAQRAFGTVGDYLKYDYSEEFGPLRKRCILEVTRSDGTRRVYSTKSEFARKSEAKTKVASLAIENGAIDFILYGEAEPKTKGFSLAPVNVPNHPVDDEEELGNSRDADMTTEATQTATVEDDSPDRTGVQGAIAEIERCCQEWRASRIKPVYYFASDTKSTDHGCALKITLSSHISRAYSVLTTFKSPEEAQVAVAQAALEQDIIDFIRHGDGQQEPMPQSAEYDLPENKAAAAAAAAEATNSEQKRKRYREKIDPNLLASKLITLAQFYDSLPQPLPEPVGVKTAEDTNPVAWLNGMLQRNRGSLLSVVYMWTIDPKLGLHGCVMRIQQGSQANRSYLVDPVFSKRQDAKIAACLEAISQGVSQWIRNIGNPIDEKMTREMKDRAKDVLIPSMITGLQRLKPSQRPEWVFSQQKHLFGCTLTVPIGPDESDSRKYSVPPEYRNRNDAKFAVALLAVEQGVLEYIRFPGGNPPADYDRDTYDNKQMMLPRKPILQGGPVDSSTHRASDDLQSRKRKYPDQDAPREFRPAHDHRPELVPRDHRPLDYSSHGVGRYDGQFRGGGFRPQGSFGYRDGPSTWDQQYQGPGHLNASSSNRGGRSFMPPRGSDYPGTYRSHDYPMTSDRDMSQAHQYQHPPRHVDERAFNHHTGPLPSRDLPLDYPPYDPYTTRRPPGPPDPTLARGELLYGSPSLPLSRSNSLAHGDADVTGAGPSTPPSAGRNFASDRFSQPPGRSLSTNGGTSRQSHTPRSLSVERNNSQPYPVSREPRARPDASMGARPFNGSQGHVGDPRRHNAVPEPLSESQLYERAQASRKRGFSKTEDSHISDPNARQWAKKSKPNGMDWEASRHEPSTPDTLVERSEPFEAKAQDRGFFRSGIAELFEYCAKNQLSTPELHNELRPSSTGSGVLEHAIWIVVGKERMELPATFADLSAGQEKLSRQVLKRLAQAA